MSSTTVAEFANELKKSTDTLLEQLRSAGVAKTAPTDAISEADKQKLLGYLQASHGTATPERKKITLVKKSTSEIKQADSSGKARTIQVEVRKKRTFVKRDEGGDTAVVEAPEPEVAQPATAPSVEDSELARREEEARRQAELIRRQEEDLAEKRRQREALEKREREAEERAANFAATEDEKKAKVSSEKAEATQEAAAAAAARAAAQVEAREKSAAESKARADEETARAADLGDRRRFGRHRAAAQTRR